VGETINPATAGLDETNIEAIYYFCLLKNKKGFEYKVIIYL